ncbi:MAG: hypothetical protein ACXWKO_04595, partial [Phenylobacterium sp.]
AAFSAAGGVSLGGICTIVGGAGLGAGCALAKPAAALAATTSQRRRRRVDGGVDLDGIGSAYLGVQAS